MRAKDIMTREVITIGVDASVREAAELMTGHSVTSLPVLDADGRVIGIVSEADLIRDRMPRDRRSHLRVEPEPQSDPSLLVREVMTDTVVCLGEQADCADVAAVMLDDNVRAVPIVDGAHLVGIVSRRDLLRTLLRDKAAILSDVNHRLDLYSGHSGGWNVTVEDGVVSIDGPCADAAERAALTVLASTVPGVLRVHTKARHVWM